MNREALGAYKKLETRLTHERQQVSLAIERMTQAMKIKTKGGQGQAIDAVVAFAVEARERLGTMVDLASKFQVEFLGKPAPKKPENGDDADHDEHKVE